MPCFITLLEILESIDIFYRLIILSYCITWKVDMTDAALRLIMSLECFVQQNEIILYISVHNDRFYK